MYTLYSSVVEMAAIYASGEKLFGGKGATLHCRNDDQFFFLFFGQKARIANAFVRDCFVAQYRACFGLRRYLFCSLRFASHFFCGALALSFKRACVETKCLRGSLFC